MANLPGTVWQKVVPFFGAPPQWVPQGSVATGPAGANGLPGPQGIQGPPGPATPGPQGSPGSVNGAGIRGTVVQGRLTLDSANPVSTTNQTGKSTLYLLPFINDGGGQNTSGNIVTYNGVSWNSFAFGSTSLNINGLTSGKNYDVFAYVASNNLNLTISAAWTNDTTRADALAVQDGVLVNSQTYASGVCVPGIGLWVGTIRMSGAGVCEDSSSSRFVWNAYNRVPRALISKETATTWTYTTATYRPMNNATAVGVERVQLLLGALIEPVELVATGIAFNSSNPFVASGVGVDSTSTNSADIVGGFNASVPSLYKGYPGLGFHFLQQLEISQAEGTTNWYGTDGLTFVQSGMSGHVFA